MTSLTLNSNGVDLPHKGNLKHGFGYDSGGKYKKNYKGNKTLSYTAWDNMIKRCYCPKTQARRPTYIGCSIVDEWRDFQAFAEWFENNEYSGLGYQLDKDLLFPGNKVYSPDTCCLIPRELNVLLVDHGRARGDFPIGVYLHKATGKYASRIRINGKDTFLGYFEHPDDAYKSYVLAKEAYVKDKALEWEGRISREVYDALMSWRVTS